MRVIAVVVEVDKENQQALVRREDTGEERWVPLEELKVEQEN